MKDKSVINVLLIAAIAVNITSYALDSSKIDVNESDITEDILNEEKLEISSTQKIVETLCSDEFGGRLVGSEGNISLKNESEISNKLTDAVKYGFKKTRFNGT